MAKNKKPGIKESILDGSCFAFERDGFMPSLTAEERALLYHPTNLVGLIPAALDCLLGKDRAGSQYALPFAWTFSSDTDRIIPYNLQSFRYQYCLILEYFGTKEEALLDLFIRWVFDWIAAHPSIEASDKWAWHDDATSKRVFYFCMLLTCFEKLLTDEQIRLLRQSLRMQARLLSREDFYRFGHNHGMYQDMALAMYALCCGEETEYYFRLSAARSWAYFLQCYNEEGAHKEHSPQYHTGMARSLKWFYIVFRDREPEYAQQLDVMLNNAQAYAAWITMPDCTLPSIGDSPKAHKNLIGIWNDPQYVYTASYGLEGQAPTERMKVFPRSGYGVLRKDWSMNGSGTWMMLLAATHSEAHKHNDDLSFLLYHGGGELITEAGSRNYNYSDPLTEYCYSSYGHNVLFVDGKGWGMKPGGLPLIDDAAYETGITAWEDTPDVSSVTGRQIRFPGVIQERTLRYDRKKDFVTVEDRITSEKPAALRLIYHFAPGVTAEREGPLCWLLRRENAAIARACLEGNAADLKAQLLTECDPPWRTAIFWGKPEIQRGSLLAADWSKEKKCALSIIRLRIELL